MSTRQCCWLAVLCWCWATVVLASSSAHRGVYLHRLSAVFDTLDLNGDNCLSAQETVRMWHALEDHETRILATLDASVRPYDFDMSQWAGDSLYQSPALRALQTMTESYASRKGVERTRMLMRGCPTNSLSRALFLENFEYLGSSTGMTLAETPGDSPQQIHIMLRTPDSYSVQWVTFDRMASSYVQYFVATPDDSGACAVAGVTMTRPATVATYNVSSGWTGWVHTVVAQWTAADNMLGCAVSYRVCGDHSGSVREQVCSGWNTFVPPAMRSRDSDMQIVAYYGDIGTVIPVGWKVNWLMYNISLQLPTGRNYDQVVALGDLSYAAVNSDGEYEPIWDLFGQIIQPLASKSMYAVVTGNHEKFYNFSAFRTRFTTPGNGQTPFWYSYDDNLVHTVVISTEHALHSDSPQYLWLLSDLASINRTRTPWVVACFHFPMYASDFFEHWNTGVGSKVQEELEPVLLAYHVDFVFTGHHHVYERTFPIVNGTVAPGGVYTRDTYHNPGGPVHVMVGTGGAIYPDIWLKQPAWSVSRIQEYGYGEMRYLNASYCEWRWYSQHGHVKDRFVVVRSG